MDFVHFIGIVGMQLTRCIGVTVSAVKELVETVDSLNGRLKMLEK